MEVMGTLRETLMQVLHQEHHHEALRGWWYIWCWPFSPPLRKKIFNLKGHLRPAALGHWWNITATGERTTLPRPRSSICRENGLKTTEDDTSINGRDGKEKLHSWRGGTCKGHTPETQTHSAVQILNMKTLENNPFSHIYQQVSSIGNSGMQVGKQTQTHYGQQHKGKTQSQEEKQKVTERVWGLGGPQQEPTADMAQPRARLLPFPPQNPWPYITYLAFNKKVQGIPKGKKNRLKRQSNHWNHTQIWYRCWN